MPAKQKRDGNAAMFSAKTSKCAKKKKQKVKNDLYRSVIKEPGVAEVAAQLKTVKVRITELLEKEKEVENKLKVLKKEKNALKKEILDARAAEDVLEGELKDTKKATAKKKREDKKKVPFKVKMSFNK